MMNTERYSQPLLVANTTQLSESDEGGLNLGQVAAAIRRRAWIVVGVTTIVAAAALVKAKNDPPVYNGDFDILTNPVTSQGKVISSSVPDAFSKDKVQEAASGVAASGQLDQTKIEVLKSPGVLSPIIKTLQQSYPKINYEDFSKELTITSDPTKPNILHVKYTDEDPELVKQSVHLLAQAYLDYSLQERQQDINDGVKFVKAQLPAIETQVQLWQKRLQTIRSSNNMIDPESRGTQLSGEIIALTQQRLDTQTQLQQMLTMYSDLQKELTQRQESSPANAAHSILTDNPRYQKVLDRIQEVDAQLAKESTIYTNATPKIQALQDQRHNLLPLLVQEGQRVQRDLTSRINNLQAREQSLSQNINRINSSVQNLARINREYSDIQRELKVSTENLNQFLAKREALKIDLSQRQVPWHLLSAEKVDAIVPEAVSKGAKLKLALGTILGLLLGLGAALVVDKIANVLYTYKELKELTRLPLLGVIPLKKELQSAPMPATLLPSNNGDTIYQPAPFFEVFRSLYTNILLLGSDTPIRSIVISSATQEDGKSTVAANLAQAAAAMGQRVLLVDANLRNPSLHNRLGVVNIHGLTDVISQDQDVNNAIERSPLEENLFVLPAGPTPPDPIRLLASRKMQDLMQRLHENYDLVIYDTPPMLGFADAYLLAAHTNGLVLVAGLGKLKRSVLQHALEDIQVSGTQVLGVVANRSKDSAPVSHTNYQRAYRLNANGEVEEETSSPILNSLRRIGRG